MPLQLVASPELRVWAAFGEWRSGLAGLRICLGPHLPQLHSGLGEGRPPGFGQRDGSRWHQKREQVLPVFGWRGWDSKHQGPSPAQNKDAAPSSAAYLLNQRNHPPLQPEWALGGWIRLHNILKRGN